MTTDKLERLARRMVFGGLPLVKWQKVVDKLTSQEVDDLTRKLDGISAQAALAAGYTGAREFSEHGQCVLEAMNRRHRNVRKALGYFITRDLKF